LIVLTELFQNDQCKNGLGSQSNRIINREELT
jgi:hypothetical protein